jgi:hypothetical protein
MREAGDNQLYSLPYDVATRLKLFVCDGAPWFGQSVSPTTELFPDNSAENIPSTARSVTICLCDAWGMV